MNEPLNDELNKEDTLQVKDIVNKARSGVRYLKSKWLLILICGVIAAVIGFGYGMIKKVSYTASCRFVLQENSSGGGLSQYSALASLVGIDMGGGRNGVFQSDNIIELYKSHLMISKTLLSPVVINNKQQLLIDTYADFTGLRKQWLNDQKIGNINFAGDPTKFSRKQDSIIKSISQAINNGILNVLKPDKKLNFITVAVTSKNEVFSKMFVDKLVETVNDFYVQTKTKKENQNLSLIQKQADSIRAVLNSSLRGVASAVDATPNANPSMVSLQVPSQRKQIDVQANSAMYAEIVKNLEISKISLRQETPLIQVIDAPVYPLDNDRLGKTKAAAVGFLLGVIIALLGLILVKLYSFLMR